MKNLVTKKQKYAKPTLKSVGKIEKLTLKIGSTTDGYGAFE